MTRHNVDDLRIVNIQEVVPPSHVLRDFPCNDAAGDTVFEARRAIHAILDGSDDRLLVVVGPCSVHDPASARDYARLLMAERERLKDRLEIVMRQVVDPNDLDRQIVVASCFVCRGGNVLGCSGQILL